MPDISKYLKQAEELDKKRGISSNPSVMPTVTPGGTVTQTAGPDISAYLAQAEKLDRERSAAPTTTPNTTRADGAGVGGNGYEIQMPKLEISALGAGGGAKDGNLWDRIRDTISGGIKQSVGGNVDTMGTMYEATQGQRDTLYDQQREWTAHQLARAEADLAAYTADGNAYMAKVTQGEVERLRTQLNAYDTVKQEQVQQKATTAARDMAAQVTQRGAQDIERAKEGLGLVGQALVDAGASGVQMLGDAGLGALTGVGGVAPMAFRAFGGGTQKARAEGADLGEQILHGGAQAAKEWVTEKLFSVALPFAKTYGKGSLDDVVEKSIGKAVDRFAKSALGKRALGGGLTMGAAALGEGLEEGLGTFLEWQMPRIYGGDVASFGETLEEAAYNTLVGSLSGLAGGVVTPQVWNYQQTAPQTAQGGAEAAQEAQNAPVTGRETPATAEGAEAALRGIAEAIVRGGYAVTGDARTIYNDAVRPAIGQKAAVEAAERAVRDSTILPTAPRTLAEIEADVAAAQRSFDEAEEAQQYTDGTAYDRAVEQSYAAQIKLAVLNYEKQLLQTPATAQEAQNAPTAGSETHAPAEGAQRPQRGAKRPAWGAYMEEGNLFGGGKQRAGFTSLENAMANQFERETGISIESVESILGGLANGDYNSANWVARIAQDAKDPKMVVVAHELTHHLQTLAPQEYESFRTAVADYFTRAGGEAALTDMMNRYRSAYGAAGQNLSDSAVMDELAADFTEVLLTDADLFGKFAQQNRTVAERLLDALRAFIEKIRATFTGRARDAAAQEATGKTLNELEMIAEQWQSVYRAAAAAYGQNANTATQEGDGVRYDLGANAYDGKSMTENGEIYSYNFLSALPDMHVLTMPALNEVKTDGRIDQNKAVNMGLENAKSVGRELPDGSAAVKNRYTGREIVVSKSGLKHGLDSGDVKNIARLRTNSRLSAIGGDIIANAVPINALTNKNRQAEGTYAMAALLESDDRDVVAIVTVEQHKGNVVGIDYVDITHAISGRLQKNKSTRSSTREKGYGLSAAPTTDASDIKVADFLDIVNSTYQSLLSEDVLAHFNAQKDPNGYYSGRTLYSLNTVGAEMDSDGRQLSDGQKAYFANSKVVDEQGRLRSLYHQTEEAFTVFDTRHQGAGSRDNSTPFGIFLKSSDRDIGLKGKHQMELYANITNPLYAKNREELTYKLLKLSNEYEAIKAEIDTLDATYHEKFEQAKKALRNFMTKWRSENPNASRRALYDVEEFNTLYDAEDEVVEEWTRKANQLSWRAKSAITEALRNAGYDGVILSTDAGSFGRSTDAYIALDPEQVKNVDNLTPTDNPDIRKQLKSTASLRQMMAEMPQQMMIRMPRLTTVAQDEAEAAGVEAAPVEDTVQLPQLGLTDADVPGAEPLTRQDIAREMAWRQRMANEPAAPQAMGEVRLPDLNADVEEAGMGVADFTGNVETVPQEATAEILSALEDLSRDMEAPMETPTDATVRDAESLISAETVKAPQSLKEKAAESWAFFKRKMVDSGEAVTQIGKAINDKYLYPFYNMARASASAGANMIAEEQTDVNGQTVGKSLNAIFDPIRAKGEEYYNQFQTYMYDLHNIARMSMDEKAKEAQQEAKAAMAEYAAEHPEFLNMTEAEVQRQSNDIDELKAEDAKEYLRLIRWVNRTNKMGNKPVFDYDFTAEMSRGRSERMLREHPEFAQYREQVRKYIDNMMQYRVDSGLITQLDANFLRKYYPDYIPTYRRQAFEDFGAAVKKKRVQIGKTVGRATGGNKKLVPLHEALGKQTMQVVREGSKNRFGARLLQDYAANALNADINRYVQKAEEYESDFSIDTFDSIDDVKPKRGNTFSVYLGGKLYDMTVDNALFEAVEALSPTATEQNTVTKVVHDVNKLYKALITGYNPTFAIRNTVRDLQTAGLYSRDFAAWAKNWPKALAEIKNDGPMWKQYKALGGDFSSVFDYATGTVKKPTTKAGKVVEKVQALNMAMEQAPRLAEFMSVMEKGDGSMESAMDAMLAAADVTVNFGRSGTWGKMLNANYVPFLNPGIQGFDKMVRYATQSRSGKQWLMMAARAAALGIAPSLINAILYHDDEEWEELRDSDKDTNYMFKMKDGMWLKIPKGRELSVLGIAADRVGDALQGEEVDIRATLNTMANQVAPANPLNQNILKAAYDTQLFDPSSPGRTWYGGDIEGQRLQNYAPGERYDSSTDVVSKAVGGALNLSPKKLNYLADQYTGVVGDIVLPLLTPQAERDMFSKAFTVDSISSNELSGRFYDKSDELTYAKNGGDAVAAVVSRYWNRVGSEVSALYGEIRNVENSNLSNREKKEQVQELQRQINAVQREALATVDQYTAAVEGSLFGDDDDAADVAYRETNREVFGAKSALETYNKDVYAKAQEAAKNGVSYEAYYDYYFATKDIESDKDASGKVIPDSKRDKTLAEIHAMDLTVEQKNVLYFDKGYAESRLYEAPWYTIQMPRI